MLKRIKKAVNGLKGLLFEGRLPWRVYLLLIKLKVYYYRTFWQKRILRTKPILTGKDVPYFEIHCLVCHRDIYMILWTLKSFFRFSEKKFFVVLHDDGSLTHNDVPILKKHLIDVRIILKKEADQIINDKLQQYPYLKLFRLPTKEGLERLYETEKINYSFLPFSIKLVDTNLLSDAKKIMMLDSDILFFKQPKEIFNWIENSEDEKSIYQVEAFDSFYEDKYNIKFKLKEKIPTYVNAGLALYNKRIFDLDVIEEWIKGNKKIAFTMRTAEQQVYEVLMRRHTLEPLPRTYSFNNHEDISIATHFGIKHLYFENLSDVHIF